MKLFIKELSVTSLGIFILILLSSFLGAQENGLSLVTYCIFLGLSIGLYIISNKLAIHPNKQLFLSFTMINTMIKMVVSVVILWVFKENYLPENGKFLIPFLIIYFGFTIFETKFMLRIAHQKS